PRAQAHQACAEGAARKCPGVIDTCLCDRQGDAATSAAHRLAREISSGDPARELLAQQRARVKEDVIRPVIARVGVLDRHVHLSSGTLGEPEIPDLVFCWPGGTTGVSGRRAERAWRRDRGSLRLAQPLEEAR